MTVSYMTAAAFNQNPSRAKREARNHPVVITERGRNSYVLMRYEDYEANLPRQTLYDALNDPRPEADFDWGPERYDFPVREIEW